MMIRATTFARVAVPIVVAAALACSGNSVSAPSAKSVGGDGTTSGGNDTSTASPADSSGNSHSGGAGMALFVSPEAATVHVHYYLALKAIERDAAGNVGVKQATWRSLDPSIATVGDTELVYGVKVGVTKIFANVDGLDDSAVVAVVDSGATTPTPPPDSSVIPPDSSVTAPDSGQAPPPNNAPPSDTAYYALPDSAASMAGR